MDSQWAVADTLDTASCGSEVGQVILDASLIEEGFCFKEGKQNQRNRSWKSRASVCCGWEQGGVD